MEPKVQAVQEEARSIPVFEDVDVLVAGGGLAGVAAATAAARAGARTLLLERNGCLGGVACASMMASIGNRLVFADGTQVIEGLAGEIVDRLVAVGGASPNWRKHKAIPLDSERLKVVLIELLDEAGVTTLTHSMACQPLMDGQEVKGCFFESKSGRQAILAQNTVDCTGEADLATRAGAEVNEHRYSSTLLFKLANVDIDRFVDFLGQDPDGFPDLVDSVKDYEECARFWREDGVFFFPHHGGMKWRWLQQAMDKAAYGVAKGKRRWWGIAENIEAFGMYTSRRDGTLVINTGYYCMDKIDVRDIAPAELHAQKLCYYAADFMIKNIPGFENAWVEHIGTDLGLRGGRYITGRSKLRHEDMKGSKQNTHKDDVIATTPIQPAPEDVGLGFAGVYNTSCDVPFGSCVPQGTSRVLVGSGKSVDTEGGNWRIYRGMSGCMVYGQATGACAALAARAGKAAEDLPIRDLQQELLRQGVRLGDEARLAELELTCTTKA